ncbi:MAG TPA: sigma-70 family RNA polymerase sigma factor [Stellaceae bacterium]|nr:sigma-70 family RNA polymerase sigma factor [Stellaceae bacterium]
MAIDPHGGGEQHLDGLVDHLFRHASGQMVAAVARLVGPNRLDLAEEVVQDALLRALQTWPFSGVPDNPRGWLFQVARNRALDILRRETVLRGKLQWSDALVDLMPHAEARTGHSVGDEELAMMFMCCHPALPEAARVALTLKLVGGFSVDEIADAFLAQSAAIAQRLVRAKRQIRDESIPLEIPADGELHERVSSVLDVLYLLFNEGYGAHGGDNLTRADLCGEAIRLARLVAENPHTDRPAAHALLALMLLQASRLPARTDEVGDLLLLADQDRARWDRASISEGMAHLDRAAAGTELTPYHIEAAIAACHATARDAASTDWPYVLRLYDELLRLKPSPVVALNRAVALAMVAGPAAGIAALSALRADAAMDAYHLLPSVLAGLELRAGDRDAAAEHYREALAFRCSAPERRFMQKQLDAIAGSN